MRSPGVGFATSPLRPDQYVNEQCRRPAEAAVTVTSTGPRIGVLTEASLRDQANKIISRLRSQMPRPDLYAERLGALMWLFTVERGESVMQGLVALR
jgi:hypothetical protein